MNFDISIDGRGFYSITANTPKAQRWMRKTVQGTVGDTAYSDDSRLAQDIADGAIDRGFTVAVNDRQYLGQNRVA